MGALSWQLVHDECDWLPVASLEGPRRSNEMDAIETTTRSIALNNRRSTHLAWRSSILNCNLGGQRLDQNLPGNCKCLLCELVRSLRTKKQKVVRTDFAPTILRRNISGIYLQRLKGAVFTNEYRLTRLSDFKAKKVKSSKLFRTRTKVAKRKSKGFGRRRFAFDSIGISSNDPAQK
jgi:hypothetical protein